MEKEITEIDLKKIKDEYGLSWKQLGVKLGKSERAMYSYLSKERRIPESLSLLVKRIFSDFFNKQQKGKNDSYKAN